MTEYKAPTQDMAFTLREVASFFDMVKTCGYSDVSDELVSAILDEAAKFSGSVLSPLNKSGDRAGISLNTNGEVVTPEGFASAYQHYVDGGWGSLQFDPHYDGQGLPFSLAIPVQEMLHAANMAWGLCPLLSQGAVEAIFENANTKVKDLFLRPMVSGRWSGTMNLTEPQSGSDLATLRTSARQNGDHYLIRGSKIFITWGEHEMAENIVHLVLARLPDAPAGVKGISLFAVPKYLVNKDGALGERNDCRALSLEHKLGIHASPTCVMGFGDNGGAVGYLVGEENKGLACMFTMMNNARLTVGLQGVAIAERAYQDARAYAFDRVQGIAPGDSTPSPIVRHPDVRRMLMTMKALTEAGRCLAYTGCTAVDMAKSSNENAESRQYYQRRADVMTPLVKGWCTEIAQEVTSLAIQCHGGMGFVEETGVAQHYRDARILPIYEGTNGIQALDLIGRKTRRDQGAGINELLSDIKQFCNSDRTQRELKASTLERLAQATAFVEIALERVLENQHDEAFCGSVAFSYMMLTATTNAGWLLTKAALRAAELSRQSSQPAPWLKAKVQTADFFADHILPRCSGYLASIVAGSESTMALDEASF
jgi:alkylation response protein AidB-like acyl-CoA dehydrogenase